MNGFANHFFTTFFNSASMLFPKSSYIYRLHSFLLLCIIVVYDVISFSFSFSFSFTFSTVALLNTWRFSSFVPPPCMNHVTHLKCFNRSILSILMVYQTLISFLLVLEPSFLLHSRIYFTKYLRQVCEHFFSTSSYLNSIINKIQCTIHISGVHACRHTLNLIQTQFYPSCV